ncbi:PREDICTED: uncharacterized protein LOC106864479, partial [Sturnus vulgaris]|uniref:uncharacterized protein LOC106864479 n=1 Tax=Sturnus vulgaris TaxID=9172 RepID=UPI00071A1B8B
MQYPFTRLQHIASPFQTRVNSSADPSRNQLWLQLLSPTAADTATYFCTMRELEKGTVLETQAGLAQNWKEGYSSFIGMSLSSVSTDKLIFEPGTTLTVLPNISNTSNPQVIVMKSKKLEEGGSPGKAACLARNIQTKSISLEMPSKEVVYEQSRSILTSEGLYNAIKVVNVTKDTELTCTAKFDNSTMTTTHPEEEADEPVAEGPSKRVCNSTEPKHSAQG